MVVLHGSARGLDAAAGTSVALLDGRNAHTEDWVDSTAMSSPIGADGDLQSVVADHADEGREAVARADWERRKVLKSGDAPANRPASLPVPTGVHAVGAVGHIRLSWNPVPGAAGYLIERTAAQNGPPRTLDHGGSDVPAVSTNEFADTGIRDAAEYSYRIGAVSGAGRSTQAWSELVSARTLDGPAGLVEVGVDGAKVTGRLKRVWNMVGSERLSQLCLGGDEQWIATEFAAALRQAHDDLGVTLVRAHAILHDDNNVVRRDAAGNLQYTFDRVDAIYDQLAEMGIRPVVELSFMPAALARDPKQTVFVYKGIISPPARWGEWRELIGALATHLVQRYGIDEVAHWAFEVWNEPNLGAFWSGTYQEYLRLYDESVTAIKSVDPRLRVGGPSTAAGGWVESFAAHAASQGVPLDFISTHTYGNLPLDARWALHENGFDGVPIWWTEWGVASTHFGPIHDGVMGAQFVLSGFAAAQGRLDALAYWVVSDHFEELGRPPRLFHNGFGLLSVGNLRKPRYWAVHLAAHLGDEVLDSHVRGDGADVLVQAWATRHDDGTIDILVWNGTINAQLLGGDARLDRNVRLRITGLDDAGYEVALARIDQQHSNVVAYCPPEVRWPDEELWALMRAHDQLHEERLADIGPDDLQAEFHLAIPMPGVARIRLLPAQSSRPTRTEKENET